MKKLSLLFVALSCILFACKKDKDESEHLTAKIDGQSVSFGDSATAKLEVLNQTTTLHLVGNAYNSGTQNLTINLQTTKLLSVGTYTDTTKDVIINAFWADGMSNPYRTPGVLPTSAYNHFVLNITSFDEKTVRGDFSGDLFEAVSGSTNTKAITNGSFYLKLQP